MARVEKKEVKVEKKEDKKPETNSIGEPLLKENIRKE